MRASSLQTVVLLLSAGLGCSLNDRAPASRLSPLSAGEAVIAQVVPLVSASLSPSVAIRQVNAYLLAVPSDVPLTVSAPGATLSADTVTTDAFGYAQVQLTVPGPGQYAVSAGGGSAGTVWVTGAPPLQQSAIRTAVYPLAAPSPSFAAAGTGGDAFAGGDQIWWQPHAPGSMSWITADLPGTIEGMWSTHVDGDGVLDLVVWTETQVLALRGWSGGGYAWGSGWESTDGLISGVSTEDLNGDRATDIAISLNYDEGEAEVEVLLGDGAWSFAALEPLQVTFTTDSIAAADEDADGQPDLTLLSAADGILRRFSLQEEDGWVGGAPAQVGEGSYQALEGSVLLPMTDLNGDAVLEILIQGARGVSSQDLVFFSLGGESIVKHEQAYANYYATVADMENDGAGEIMAVEDGTLHMTRYDPLGNTYLSQNYDSIGTAGPVTVGNLDGNELLDLVVFNEAPTYYPGAASEGAASLPGDPDCQDAADNDGDGLVDAEDPECAIWRPATYGWQTFDLAIAGPYLIEDINGDGLDDFLGFTDATGELALGTWLSSVDSGGDIQLTPGNDWIAGNAEGLGLVTCGGEYFALTRNGKQVVLSEIFVSNSGAVTQGDWGPVAGTLLSCGTIGTVTVAAVVSTTGGAWTSYNRNIAEVDTGFIEAVQAITVADPDGDGVGEVLGCESQGCAIVAADFDGDGQDEVVRAEAAGLTIAGWGTSQELAGTPGPLRAVDANRDGIAELLVTDESGGRVLWYRGVAGGLTPPLGWWRGEARGASALADVDGDGVPELIVPTAEGSLAHAPNP